MAHATAKTDHPSPSLFISYASEDREVARRLRDTLSAQGIDVWYDEDELTGGDAWDKKIRDRIRACDYFMPLISNATEARREGYFRREWRQAAERTLDMSDDVMFLLPVNIDNVSEYGARVPERFTQVQWTRCPAGESNPDLAALCDRMLRRDDAAPVVTSTPPVPPVGKKHDRKSLPPYPPQSIRTSDEPAWLHAFNLVVWVVRCAYRAYRGFPRLLRWVVIFWFIAVVMKSCEVIRGQKGTPVFQVTNPASPESPQTPVDMDKVAQELKGLEKFGGFGRIIGAVADAAQAGRPLALVPFATISGSAATNEVVDSIFADLMAALRVNWDDKIAVSPSSLGANPSLSDINTRTARIESKFLLTGWTETDPTDQTLQLVVLLHAAGSPTSIWTGRYPLAGASSAIIVEQIQLALSAHEVFASVPPATARPEVPAEPTS